MGDKKIVYLPNSEASGSMSFTTVAPLEPGENQIVIGARDAEDLMTRKVIIVERTSGQKKKGGRPRAQPDFMR